MNIKIILPVCNTPEGAFITYEEKHYRVVDKIIVPGYGDVSPEKTYRYIVNKEEAIAVPPSEEVVWHTTVAESYKWFTQDMK